MNSAGRTRTTGKGRTGAPRAVRSVLRAGVGISVAAALVAGSTGGANAARPSPNDLSFILRQIQIAEANAAGGQLAGNGPNQIPSPVLPWGLRTVSGSFNNLVPGQSQFGTADRIFPRLAAPFWRPAEPFDPDGPGPAPATPTSYTQKKGVVADSQPRTISNLIADSSPNNPAAAAVAARTPGSALVANTDPNNPANPDSYFIPNKAPDAGLSAPYNSWFTLFGQFFDHGLDLTNKGGSGSVIVPLKTDDPLYVAGSPTNFMPLTRATNLPGPDGKVGDDPTTAADESADDVQEATNQTSPFVDQNQTYGSHPSQQVFLRAYELDGGKPVSTGKLITGSSGSGMATWADVKNQARTMLGIAMDDQEALGVPLLLTDQYGNFIPDPATGFAQIVTGTNPLTTASGTPANPVDASLALRAGRAFLDDIANGANPFGDNDNNRQTPNGPMLPDDNTVIGGPPQAGRYDDELLNEHFIAGDGRVNENIGLTAVHQVFHAEHNLAVDDIKALLLQQSPDVLAQWQLRPGVWNGQRLFQAGRYVTEMQYQQIVFDEFARTVQPQVNLFAGYKTEVDPAITTEFAQVAYRFGHSLLTETVARTRADGTTDDIGLIQAFLNPVEYRDDGNGGKLSPETAAANVARGMSSQVGNEVDEFVTGALRNNLVGLPLDLATINIARGRETGIPSLNTARRQFFTATGDAALAPYDSWNDFKSGIRNPESLVNFVAAYGTHPTVTAATTFADKRAAAALLVNGGDGAPADRLAFLNSTDGYANGAGGVTTTGVDLIDFWMGGLAERQMPFGGLLGSSFNFVFETQMEKLQDGDRLYYLSRNAGLDFLGSLEQTSLAEMVMRTTETMALPFAIFTTPDFTFNAGNLGTSGPVPDDTTTPYDESALLTRSADGSIRFIGEEHVVVGGTAGDDGLRSGNGDDTLWGQGGNDRLDGGAGNDALLGGDGDDRITDTFGDDTIKGEAGNDVINPGSGLDTVFGGAGQDFVYANTDDKEVFGEAGTDFINSGNGLSTVMGGAGDDWVEGYNQGNILAGENLDPLAIDPTRGNDVISGVAEHFEGEGGNDIMVSGPGVQRSIGALGFDWVTHRGDPVPANSDLNLLVLPADLAAIRDRFTAIEGLSGWEKDDVLRGSDADALTMVGHELNNAGEIAMINGLGAVLGAGVTSFTGGDILLGGLGSDLIEGRAGNDVIDADAWLNVQLSGRRADGTEVRADTMAQLQAEVFAGTINPGNISIVREILTPAPAANDIDTVVFSDVRASYDVNRDGNTVTVTHARGTQTDGTDTVKNAERLTFADQTVEVVNIPTNTPATGTVTISDTTPTEDQVLTATPAFSDLDGINQASIVYSWQAETAPDVWATIGTGVSFTAGDEAAGRRLRVVATFLDGDGVQESVTSDPTAVVININDPATGTPVLSDLTPPVGVPVTVDTAPIADPDGLVGVTFTYQWQQRLGTAAFTNIAGATGASFTPTTGQAGRDLRAVVSFTDNQGTAEQRISNEARVPSVPGAPTGVSAVAGNTQATVSWSPPASDGGSAITEYRIQVRTGTTLVRTVTGISGTTASSVVTGLTNGTAYNFRVRAVNSSGQGALSRPSNAVTPAGTVVVTPPGAPTIGTATAGNTSATVNWTAPANTGGAAITEYRIEVRTGTTVVRTVTGVAGTATSSVVTGLTNGTPYNFGVRAVNSAGQGAMSAASNAVTPTTATATLPDAPVIGTAVRGSAAGAPINATANWSPPASDGGSAITGYRVFALRIQNRAVVATTQSAVLPPTARSLTMALPVAGSYRFQVVAINAVGTSPRSARSNQVAGR